MTPPEDDRPGGPAERTTPGHEGPAPHDDRTDPRIQPFRGPTFQPGEFLAGRFRILRFVAAGGMGEVYEAEDRVLGERVALKTLQPQVAEDKRAMDRFRREIQLARKVTHGSVCRTFDVFRHRLAPPPDWHGPPPEVTFLSMEFLEGETLAGRIRRAGALTTDEALPIVRQVASALAAAHDAGIVHRDFKSENVLLVPTTKGELRVVVTDFGMARTIEAGGEESLTGTGMLAGTPAYMAPEQIAGGEVTPATDVYALGIVMYEMVTGKRPFEGGTPIGTAVRRLTERPAPPRSQVEGLDPRWEVVILRCLERSPHDRFGSPRDVLKALAGEKVSPGPAEKKRRRRFLGAMAAVGILLAAGLWLRAPKPPRGRGTAPPGAPASRRSVAILGFKNLSGRSDAAWLSTALSEMLGMELAAGEKLRVIPGENVARMKIELALPDADSLAKDTLARIGTNLGADLVVLGSYFAAGREGGGRLRLDLRLQDTARGEMVASLTDAATETELLDLVSRAGAGLRDKLGVSETRPAQPRAAGAALPSTPEVARLYAEGLNRLRLFDALAARDLLEQVVAAGPNSPLAHSALSEAWSALGYEAKAREEARRALDLSAHLSREERLLIEGRYREATRDWDKAIEAYKTAWRLFPDDLDLGLRLAAAQTSAGNGKEALATVEALRRLPPPTAEDPRIDIMEATAEDSLSLSRGADAAAESAARKGEAHGARLLVAQARLLGARASMKLGELERSAQRAKEARRLFEAAGDRSGAARAVNSLANVLWYQGDLAGARRLYEQCLRIGRETGDRRAVATALNNIADVLSDQGDFADSARLYEESVAIARETGDRVGLALRLSNIGVVRHRQGQLGAARRMFEESLAAAREVGDRRVSGYALWGLGETLVAEGNLSEARRRHEEALAVRLEIAERGTAAESRAALAAVSLEEEKPAEAERLAREAAQEFRKEKQATYEAWTLALLARTLLAQGRLGEAQGAAEGARALVEKGQNLDARLVVAVAGARVRAASGQWAEALKVLEATLDEATRAGLLPLALEARLALGETEIASGKTGPGRARLAALEDEASAKGFGLIALKARRSSALRGQQ